MLDWLRRHVVQAVFAVVLAAGAVAALPAQADPVEFRSVQIAGDSLKTRVLFAINEDVQPRLTLLRSPNRLVIDVPSASFRFDQKMLKPRGLVTGIRYGKLDDERSRIVLSAKGPFKITDFNVIAEEGAPGHRLVLDIEAASAREFDAALAEQSTSTGSTNARPASNQPAKRFTVVIDPGHGGIDGGANSASGTVEKEVTLAFSRELRDLMLKGGDIDVKMTRDDDRFLRLDERVRIAREFGADLFISVHADTIRLKGVSGATVYTVSDRASDAESAALATRENLADKLPGIEIEDEDHQVADILVDLIRRETHSYSMGFARTLVGEWKETISMINNPHRFAGFRVLRAPDVPSVLVELGYLSNASDEKHLLDPQWRAKAAGGIVTAVRQFAGARIGGGG